MSNLIEDSNTIERYIKSCTNFTHVNACEKLIFLLKRKYRKHPFIDTQVTILKIEMSQVRVMLRRFVR